MKFEDLKPLFSRHGKIYTTGNLAVKDPEGNFLFVDPKTGYWVPNLIDCYALPRVAASASAKAKKKRGAYLLQEEALRFENSFGITDAAITHAIFAYVEIDQASLVEQKARYKKFTEETGLEWCLQVFSGKKSIHGYIAFTSMLPASSDLRSEIQRALIVCLEGDTAITNAGRKMRMPCCMREGVEQAVLHFDKDHAYAPWDVLKRLESYASRLGIDSIADAYDDLRTAEAIYRDATKEDDARKSGLLFKVAAMLRSYRGREHPEILIKALATIGKSRVIPTAGLFDSDAPSKYPKKYVVFTEEVKALEIGDRCCCPWHQGSNPTALRKMSPASAFCFTCQTTYVDNPNNPKANIFPIHGFFDLTFDIRRQNIWRHSPFKTDENDGSNRSYEEKDGENGHTLVKGMSDAATKTSKKKLDSEIPSVLNGKCLEEFGIKEIDAERKSLISQVNPEDFRYVGPGTLDLIAIGWSREPTLEEKIKAARLDRESKELIAKRRDEWIQCDGGTSIILLPKNSKVTVFRPPCRTWSCDVCGNLKVKALVATLNKLLLPLYADEQRGVKITLTKIKKGGKDPKRQKRVWAKHKKRWQKGKIEHLIWQTHTHWYAISVNDKWGKRSTVERISHEIDALGEIDPKALKGISVLRRTPDRESLQSVVAEYWHNVMGDTKGNMSGIQCNAHQNTIISEYQKRTGETCQGHSDSRSAWVPTVVDPKTSETILRDVAVSLGTRSRVVVNCTPGFTDFTFEGVG